jgi:predicted transcriptional regulator
MKNITINPQATIKEAMEALDKTAEKVLLVVDDGQALIGTLTDGDIRRHILKGRSLSGTIQEAFHPKPIFILQEDFDTDKIKAILLKNKTELIPILDKDSKVVDFITWEKAFGNNKKSENQKLDIPVVIMAGGKGSRLDPYALPCGTDYSKPPATN